MKEALGWVPIVPLASVETPRRASGMVVSLRRPTGSSLRMFIFRRFIPRLQGSLYTPPIPVVFPENRE